MVITERVLVCAPRKITNGGQSRATPSSDSYIVRARNDNTFLDSAATAALVREVFRITSVTRTGPAGQNLALTFPATPEPSTACSKAPPSPPAPAARRRSPCPPP